MSDADTNNTVPIGAFGVKKSNFTQQTTPVPAKATLDFVNNGTNLKITLDDLLQGATLSVLTPVGDAGATPVLEQIGETNNIRGLNDGSGILTSISAGNGITIKHNFTQNAVGEPVFINPLLTSPTFASISAGTGIAVSTTNNVISIAVTGGAAVTNTVIINDVDDFPAPVSGIITLEDNKTYLLEALVDISPNRIVFGLGNSIFAENRVTRGLTSDTTGALLTISGSTKTPEILDMILNAPNGKILDVNTGAGVVMGNVLTINSAAVSTFADTGNVSFRQWSIVDGGSGVFGCVWSGTCSEFNCNNGFNQNWTGILFDFGTAVFTRGMIIGTSVRFSVKSGATAISGAAASANIGTSSRGLVTSCTFDGVGTILAGISRTDDRWQFTDAGDAIADTTATGTVSIHSNAVVTGITTQSVPVKLVGTWVADDISQITGSTSGRLTYTGQKTRDMGVVATFNIERATAGTKTYRFHIALNGTVITRAFRDFEIADAAEHSGSLTWIIPGMVASDFVEIFVSNETDTDNVLVSDAVFRAFNG